MGLSIGKMDKEDKNAGDGQDQILAVLGNIGPWQWKNILITSVFCMPCAWHILCMTFMNAEVGLTVILSAF